MSASRKIVGVTLLVLASACGQNPPTPSTAPAPGGKAAVPSAAARTPRELFLGTWHRRERNDDFYIEVRGDGTIISSAPTLKVRGKPLSTTYRYTITEETPDGLKFEVEHVGVAVPCDARFPSPDELHSSLGTFSGGPWKRK
jgi:hypothetical protein